MTRSRRRRSDSSPVRSLSSARTSARASASSPSGPMIPGVPARPASVSHVETSAGASPPPRPPNGSGGQGKQTPKACGAGALPTRGPAPSTCRIRRCVAIVPAGVRRAVGGPGRASGTRALCAGVRTSVGPGVWRAAVVTREAESSGKLIFVERAGREVVPRADPLDPSRSPVRRATPNARMASAAARTFGMARVRTTSLCSSRWGGLS